MRKIVIAAGAIVTALLAVSRLLRRREDIGWRDADAPGRIATVDGVGTHYIEQGSGPAVVLVHGFGGHTFSYRHLIPDLAKDHRVVAIDLKGFGYSERPQKSDYSLGAQARLVVRLMDTLRIESAALVGHSMGGEVVMRVAARYPDRVERLVLAGSISGDRIPTLPTLPFIKPFLPLIAKLMGRRALPRSYYDPSKITKEIREGYQAPLRIYGTMDALYQMMRDFRRDKSVDFKRIMQPVLILWASNEKVVPGWTLRRLRKHFPEAIVTTIERAGHLLLEEQPEDCNAAIRRFLPPVAGRGSKTREAEAVDSGAPAS